MSTHITFHQHREQTDQNERREGRKREKKERPPPEKKEGAKKKRIKNWQITFLMMLTNFQIYRLLFLFLFFPTVFRFVSSKDRLFLLSIAASMSDAEAIASASPTSAPLNGDEANGAPAKNGIAAAAPIKGSPNDFLKKVIGKQVIVRLNSGVDYHGELHLLSSR